MESCVWRVVALAVPAWPEPCARCDRIRPHESTWRFRVNAQGSRHDVWLVYRCPHCGNRRNRRIARRLRARELGSSALAGYLGNDPDLARAHAFEVSARQPLPYRVEREVLTDARPLRILVEQRFDCCIRWDRFLAGEFDWSRSRVARAWRTGAIEIPGVARASRMVRNAQTVELRL